MEKKLRVRRSSYDVMINSRQQEFISKMLEDYKTYDDLPDNLKSLISKSDYDYLLISINYNCNKEERFRYKRLFVLVDYTNAFTIGSFANEPSKEIDLNVMKRTKEALEDPDTKVVVLIDSHDERYYLDSREGVHLPILHGHTPTERRIYGETGKLFEKYWREDNYESEDEKVYFIEKNRFGTLNIDNTINMNIIDTINVVDGLMTHRYIEDSAPQMNGLTSSDDPSKIEYDYNCLYSLLCNLYSGKWEPDDIVICGVATNVCVLSNAVILMTEYPDSEVYVYEDSVASYDMDLHKKALEIMENLGINVVKC
jgi:nicotinamidase-related amidase